MEFNNIYINDNICYEIFLNLNIKDKINFIQINKYTRDNFLFLIQNDIYNFINKDYNKFKLYINNLKYNKKQLKNIASFCTNNINYIYYYSIFFEENIKKIDIRYIFEVILLGLNKKDLYIQNKNLKVKINEIYKCLSLSRDLTMLNVMDNFELFVLHPNFYI